MCFLTSSPGGDLCWNTVTMVVELASLVPRPPQAFIACSMKSDKSLGRPGYEAMNWQHCWGGGGGGGGGGGWPEHCNSIGI